MPVQEDKHIHPWVAKRAQEKQDLQSTSISTTSAKQYDVPWNKYPSVLYTMAAIRHSLVANSLFIEDNVEGSGGLDLISRLRRITEGVLRTTGGRWMLSTLIHSHHINLLCVAIRAIAT